VAFPPGLLYLMAFVIRFVEQNIQAVPVAPNAQRLFRPNGFKRNLLGRRQFLVARQDADMMGLEVHLDALLDEHAPLGPLPG